MTSDKDLSNITVDVCEPEEDERIEFEDGTTTYEHTGNDTVVAIWVKSSSYLDPDGPAGAGEHFENPHAACTDGTEDHEREL